MRRKTDEKPVIPAAAEAEESPRGNFILSVIALCAVEVIVGSAIVRWSVPKTPPHRGMEPAAVFSQTGADVSDASSFARWAAATGDAGRRPFVIVDKAHARVMAFDASGQLRSSTPALMGSARGDDSVPGIGTRKIADILPEERITPAGRFIARKGNNLDGEDVVWVDYDAAVSMHRVRATTPSERRLQRLASETIADNRISYGCINLPPAFYEGVIRPMVDAAPVIIYVLPETRSLREVFAIGLQARPERQAAMKHG